MVVQNLQVEEPLVEVLQIEKGDSTPSCCRCWWLWHPPDCRRPKRGGSTAGRLGYTIGESTPKREIPAAMALDTGSRDCHKQDKTLKFLVDTNPFQEPAWHHPGSPERARSPAARLKPHRSSAEERNASPALYRGDPLKVQERKLLPRV